MYDSMSQDSSIVLLDLDQTGPSQGTPSDYAERDPKASSTGLYYKYPQYRRETYSASSGLGCVAQGFLKGHRP